MVRGPAGSYAAGMSVAPTHAAAAVGATEVVIRPSGEYDLATAPALWQTLTRACADRPDRVIVDLRNVDFVDMTTAGLFAGAARRVRSHGGQFRAVNPRDPVRRALALGGLNHLLVGV